jgi:hypothetical protein
VRRQLRARALDLRVRALPPVRVQLLVRVQRPVRAVQRRVPVRRLVRAALLLVSVVRPPVRAVRVVRPPVRAASLVADSPSE